MKNVIALLVISLLYSCSSEKLKLHAKTSTSGKNFPAGSTIDLKIEHNGEGIVITQNSNVISREGIFTLPVDLPFGTNKFTVSTFRGDDTLSLPLEVFVVPNTASVELSYKVVATYPHPSQLFTQGFLLDGDIIIESSGQYGESALSTYKLGSTKFIQHHTLPSTIFAEGMTLLNDTLYQVSWREQTCYSYSWNGDEFTPIGERKYSINEGWGLSAYQNSLIWTDGSQLIRWVDPHSLQTTKTMTSMNHQGYFGNLNESEIFKGKLATNIWQTDRIVFINLEDGASSAHLELTEIALKHAQEGTLNGIAVKGDHLLVTGKNWSTIYELEIDWK